MNQILRCDWLPERVRWSYLASCVPQENRVLYPYNNSFIEQACSVKMAGYWPRFFACLWTETESRSIWSGKKYSSRSEKSQGILFWVRENWNSLTRLIYYHWRLISLNERIEMKAVSWGQKPLLGPTFCIDLVKEILFLSAKSQGILKNDVCDNHTYHWAATQAQTGTLKFHSIAGNARINLSFLTFFFFSCLFNRRPWPHSRHI